MSKFTSGKKVIPKYSTTEKEKEIKIEEDDKIWERYPITYKEALINKLYEIHNKKIELEEIEVKVDILFPKQNFFFF